MNPYGFVVFDLDPGTPGGTTSITATYYALDPAASVRPVDQFTLVRPRNDR